jgi:hypothetical protein
MDETLAVHRLAHWISTSGGGTSAPVITLMRVSHPAPDDHRKPDAALHHPQKSGEPTVARLEKTESESSEIRPTY